MSRYRLMRARNQRGGVTVESAITLMIFVAILFAIMELSILVYRLSSLADATREGARHLSVNAPLIDLSGGDCSALPGPASCAGNSNCDPLVSLMQERMASLEAGNIFYQYTCASTGFDESYFQIYSIDVWVEGIEYGFLTPGLTAIEFEMPEFRATRLSEDLDTVAEE